MADYNVMFGNRLYIGIGLTIIGLFSVLMMLGVDITSDGDKVCAGTLEDPCVSYFNVTNNNYRSIYIYNYDKVKMDFTPEIKDYKLYVKYYGKWRYTNFTMETRLGNIPADRKYVFVFPARATKEFMLVGYKNNPKDNVKWGFGVSFEYLDPVWKPVKIGLEEVRYCEEVIKTREEPIIDNCEICYNISQINDGKIICEYEVYNKTDDNNYCIYEQCYEYECIKGYKTIYYTENVCKTILYKYGDEIINASDWCCYGELCGLRRDTDCNLIKKGIIHSGQSYKRLDSNFVKIDDKELKEKYYKDKDELKVADISSFELI